MGPTQFWRMERSTLFFDNWNLMGIPLDSRLIEEYKWRQLTHSECALLGGNYVSCLLKICRTLVSLIT
jgi:hypothetical protein